MGMTRMTRGWNGRMTPPGRAGGFLHGAGIPLLLGLLMTLSPGAVSITQASGGALRFEHREVEYDAKPADELVTITYRYQNTSDRPVRLTGGETNCDCLKAEADKTVLQPGEWGELRALFALGDMLGRKRQRVTMLTEEGGRAQRYDLFVNMNIPLLIEIEPDVLRWTVGSEPEEQVFDIRMTGEEPLRVTEVTSTRPTFKWRLETVEQGRHYRLRVRPESTASPTMGAMRIQTNSPIPKYQRALAYFAIQPPGR